MDIHARRRARLALIIEETAKGNVAEFARAHAYSRSQISQFLSETYNGGRSIGERAARKIEEKVGVPAGWLDLELGEAEERKLKFPFSTAELRLATNQKSAIDTSPYAPYLARIPIVAVISTASNDPMDDVNEENYPKQQFLEYYSLHRLEAYQVRGWGMRPRVKNGEFLVVNKELAPQPGDDVILTMKDKRMVAVQFLYERGTEMAFVTLNEGEATTIVEKADIESIEVVISIVHRGAEIFEEES
jgi:phage repressor protein C with HTH and peptisase S24 domain